MSHKSKKQRGPSSPSGAPSQVQVVSASGGGSDAILARPGLDIEPQADSAAVPVWLFVAMIALIYWGMLHLDQYGGGFSGRVYGPYGSYRELADLQPKSGPEMLIARGEALFALYCQLCHGVNGTGTPGQYPPLAGSQWVQGTPARLIRIPNNGLQGPITVKDQPWNANMAAIGASLQDDELAAILSYIRNAWGNKAPAVTPEQVKAVRAEIGPRPRDGTAPWSSDELLKVPETQ